MTFITINNVYIFVISIDCQIFIFEGNSFSEFIICWYNLDESYDKTQYRVTRSERGLIKFRSLMFPIEIFRLLHKY